MSKTKQVKEEPQKGPLLTIGTKIALALSFAGLVTLTLGALVSYQFAVDTFKSKAQDQLISLRTVLADFVGGFFADSKKDLLSLTRSETTLRALQEFSEARNSLPADLELQGMQLSADTMKSIRSNVTEYYQKVLINGLSKVRKGDPGDPELYMPKDDAAAILQYFYISQNPSITGQKYDFSMIEDIKGYTTVPFEWRQAFMKSRYAQHHDKYHPDFLDHLQRHSLYDFFIVNKEGYVVYSVFKELDFQGNLKFGPDKDTGLGQAFSKAMALGAEKNTSSTAIVDMAPYAKSYDAPALFEGAPVYDSQGQLVGALIIQWPVGLLNDLMTFQGRQAEVGLQQTGEAYLVGPDMLQRSEFRDVALVPANKKRVISSTDGKFLKESTLGVFDVNTVATQKIFKERQTGEMTYDNAVGVPVLGAFAPLDIPGLNWGVIVEQSQSEAFGASASQNLLRGIFIAGLAGMVLVSLVGWWYSKRLSMPIRLLDQTMREVAEGNEDARAPVLRNDEMGRLAQTFNSMLTERNAVKNQIFEENRMLQANVHDLLLVVADASEGALYGRAKVTEGALGNVCAALNEMLENFTDLISQTKSASDRVADASLEISAAAQELSDGATVQTTQVGQTSENVRLLTKEAQDVVLNAKQASEAAERTKRSAELGAKVVFDVIQIMERIRDNVQAISKKIKRLGDRSMEISSIVKAINEISVQTDMLALNASMEASRAGEQGKGFSLVAEQVRQFSERAKNLTVEIDRLVTGIQEETSEAVIQMETQTEDVESGVRSVEEAGKALEEIVRSSVQSSQTVGKINESASAQANRAQSMLSAVSNINSIAEATQSRVVATRKTSEQLSSLSTELNGQLSRFKLSQNSH